MPQGLFSCPKASAAALGGPKPRSPASLALQVIDKLKLSDPNETKRIQREIKVLKRLNHECVIKLFEVIDAPNKMHIVMEYAPAGSLLDYVRARKRLGEPQACQFFQQIVAGLAYCHANEVRSSLGCSVIGSQWNHT